jgi:hypothetical protein
MKMLVFALQQLLAILAATIAVPSIIGNGMSQSAALFGAGVGTIVYQLFTRFKSPVFLGSSFAFLPSMTAAFAGAASAAAGFAGLLIGAICAAPSVLGHKGLLKNKKATAFPGFEKELSGALVSEDFVVRDGNIITSKGAGATINFALEIVGYFKGEETKRKLRDAMQCVR